MAEVERPSVELEQQVMDAASTNPEAALALASLALVPTADVDQALKQADALEDGLDCFDMVVAHRSALVLNRRKQLAEIGRHVKEVMRLGLADVYPADDDADQEQWMARIDEWADFVHEKYAEALALTYPPLERRRG